MLRFAWRKPHFPELVHVPAGAHAAVICSVRQLLRRQVDDEFARLPDNIVGIPLRPDGDGYHSRVGTDCPDPCRCDNIRFLTCPGAAYHDCRQGIEHIARPPVLPLSWRLLWRLLWYFLCCFLWHLLSHRTLQGGIHLPQGGFSSAFGRIHLISSIC